MACPTCDHSMSGLGEQVFHCERCGTACIREEGSPVRVYIPKLVGRVHDLRSEMTVHKGGSFALWFNQVCHRLGVLEAISRPEERPEMFTKR